MCRPFAHLLYAASKTGYPVSAELQQAVTGMLLHTTLPQSAAIAASGATTGLGAAAGVGTEDVAAGPAQDKPQHPHQHSQQQQQQQQWAMRPLTGRAGLPPALLSARGYEVTMAAWAWSQLEGASPRVLHLLLEVSTMGDLAGTPLYVGVSVCGMQTRARRRVCRASAQACVSVPCCLGCRVHSLDPPFSAVHVNHCQ